MTRRHIGNDAILAGSSLSVLFDFSNRLILYDTVEVKSNIQQQIIKVLSTYIYIFPYLSGHDEKLRKFVYITVYKYRNIRIIFRKVCMYILVGSNVI